MFEPTMHLSLQEQFRLTLSINKTYFRSIRTSQSSWCISDIGLLFVSCRRMSMAGANGGMRMPEEIDNAFDAQ